MTTMSSTEAAIRLRAMLTEADDLKVIQSLEILTGMSDKGDAEKYTQSLLVDELTKRFPVVEQALDVWEFDLDTEETSEALAARVARQVLGL